MLIKKRKAKVSRRGIYLQDKELSQTQLVPGKNYKYVIDVNQRKVIILPSTSTTDNKVSKRKVNSDVIKPVIDIRDKKALSIFEGSQYLQVSIYEDQVIVEGFCQEIPGVLATIGSSLKSLLTRKNKIQDISEFLSVKKVSSITLSKRQLSKVVGDHFEQISLDLFGESERNSGEIVEIQSAIKNLHIPLEITSLFSSAGIMDLGFKEEGFDVVFALEKDVHAASTYEYNFKRRVTKADIKDYPLNWIYKAPVMIAGSPCQGFSNENRRTNFLENPKNLLVSKFIEAVKANENCVIFVLENVPQILSCGKGRFKNEIYEALSDFEIESGILSAADFGSPQKRERAIFIGSKIGKIPLPKPLLSPSHYKTVEDAFAGLSKGIPNQKDISTHDEITVNRIKSVPPGGNIFDIPEQLRPSGKHSNMYRRLEWHKPAFTIVNPRKAMILHPEEDRILSVRECARLFDVPDTFEFKGPLSSIQQMIANAVPVNLSRAIARVIKNAINRFNLTRNRKLIPNLEC